uniref:hypothetical protein n=1 Tax=Fulvivirga sp. TaxID=1931237 RepID=UPI00404B081B
MKRNHISETLYWLKGFANKIDENDDFSENAMLFYRKCKNGKYVVINHFKRKDRIEFQGFDSWICDYRVNAEPGIDSPIEIKQIKLGLKLPEDLSVLEQYY